MKCLFCGSESFASPIEHIIPESFGGSEEYTLSGGVVCKKCNGYFAKQEGIALEDYPFKYLRVFLGFPTKKGKVAKIITTSGEISAPLGGGKVFLGPYVDIHDRGKSPALASDSGTILMAEISKPLEVCRMLLKIGIEFLALRFPDIAREAMYDAAKGFCRHGKRNDTWSFIVNENVDRLQHYLMKGVGMDDTEAFGLELYGGERPNVFAFEIIGIKFFIPLVPMPPKKDEEKKETRIYRVVV